VTTDTELETWRQEWRDQTQPLPELKRKIQRQNLRTFAAIVAVCTCLAFSTIEAVRTRSWFMAGLATGIGFAAALLGAYGLWVRRGAWRPAAQTTLAYAELCYQRAISRARILRFSFRFLLIATALFTLFMAWNWKNFHARDGAIIAAMAVESFFLRYYAQRKQREIEETKQLVDGLRE
jgi:hypothetical protein